MCLHGVLAYTVSWAIAEAHLSNNLDHFVAAMTVTLWAGLVSRFTGRQALGNSAAGLYVLLPGAYMVNALFSNDSAAYLESVIIRAVTFGLGSWTGTM